MAIAVDAGRGRRWLAAAPMSYWRTVAWRLARDRATLVAGGVLALIVLSAMLAPWLAPYDPTAGSIRLRLAPVGAPGHVLGTDEQGRDMLSRLLWGGRMTLVAGLTPVLVAFVLGAALGVMAGYVGGLTNTLIMRTMDIFYAFPAVLLAIAISGALGPGLAEHPHLAVDRLRAAGRARGRVRHRAGEGPRVHRGRAGQRQPGCAPSSGTICWPTCWARSSCSRARRCRSPSSWPRACPSSGSASRRPPRSGG